MASSTSAGQDASAFNPLNADLSTANPAAVVCYLEASQNEYSGQLGARVSALFVILAVSSAVT
ncbi:hypothetical protein LTR78_006859 [Recurvomyces mirabilis]|uniref:Uncharacterized protein n=1 Tax=Recurvomyces mirabilis TaxID=574656 RepID=A0AAE1BZJ6_9PEZI|nr:hypothetical protein LTR78_006859 [Recurvomyces mirabilis]KAK5153150.1 hypothetical protein LTS14_007795 [Recurvomyces mirabilis]